MIFPKVDFSTFLIEVAGNSLEVITSGLNSKVGMNLQDRIIATLNESGGSSIDSYFSTVVSIITKEFPELHGLQGVIKYYILGTFAQKLPSNLKLFLVERVNHKTRFARPWWSVLLRNRGLCLGRLGGFGPAFEYH